MYNSRGGFDLESFFLNILKNISPTSIYNQNFFSDFSLDREIISLSFFFDLLKLPYGTVG